MGSLLRLTREGAHEVLRLDGVLDFSAAGRLRQEIFSFLDAEGPKVRIVDLEHVERIDSVALAVLVEALVYSAENGGDLLFGAISDEVREVFELAGMADALDRCFACARTAATHLETEPLVPPLTDELRVGGAI